MFPAKSPEVSTENASGSWKMVKGNWKMETAK
jgi:hypothetical protein